MILLRVQEWQQRYLSDPPLAIYVNLSARQFSDPDLVGQVVDVLRAMGLEASNLVLDITEGAAMKEAPSTLVTLRALRELA
jgi:EAL domain-containing protein (putative c-di-GMP-specific phosphodiesterase class I)